MWYIGLPFLTTLIFLLLTKLLKIETIAHLVDVVKTDFNCEIKNYYSPGQCGEVARGTHDPCLVTLWGKPTWGDDIRSTQSTDHNHKQR